MVAKQTFICIIHQGEVVSPLSFNVTLIAQCEGANMMNRNSQCQEVSAAISKAKKAFNTGELKNYEPLTVLQTEEVKSTCATSWGPQMRR